MQRANSNTADAGNALSIWFPPPMKLALKVLLVGVVCQLSTEIGFAHKLPPHNISALWPTGAILFSILVFAPARHWWAYILAAYVGSVIKDIGRGFSSAAALFITAGIVEVLIAAIGVRLFAAGTRAFNSLASLVMYFAVAVLLAPFVSAFIGASAGGVQEYWFYWRAWFLSEVLAFLMLAPAILTLVSSAHKIRKLSTMRIVEAVVALAALVAICLWVFDARSAEGVHVPALVYLPLPLLLHVAIRFGPVGVAVALAILASTSISGAVRGVGPFAMGDPAARVLSLQLFLATIAVPLLLLAAVINEVRERTQVLAESEARFRNMADTAPVLIWMSGIDKLCTYFNEPWLRFTGRTFEQELGNGWAQGVHPDDLANCLRTYTGAFDARLPFTMEYRLRHRDGEYRWVSDSGVPRYSAPGEFIGYIGTCIDITERKHSELESQQQRNELTHLARVAMLGELSASLAHELNQPLTAILSNAQAAQRFLRQEPANIEQVQAILKDIVDDDDRAGETIRRLRMLFKKGEVQRETLDVNEVIRDVLRFANSDLVNHGVAVESELSPNLKTVNGDRVQLQQVLLNLLMNGCDAMSQLDPRDRRLAVRTELASDELVRISISDRGCGIAPGQVERIFEPFVTTKAQGLGLGLAVCRTIVTAHGGAVSACNNSDRGASFLVTLPA